MRRTIIAVVAVLGLMATACTATSGETTTTSLRTSNNGGATGVRASFAAPGLAAFASCDEFLDFVTGNAVDLVGPYGFTMYGGSYGDVVFATQAAGLDEADTSTAAPRAVQGVDYSGTNVQVAGVDEPDVVKTDGDRIFVVAQGALHWIDASGEPEVVASLPLDGWGQQIFLAGDRVLVTTSGGGFGPVPIAEDRAEADFAPTYASPRTVLTEIDVSDPSSMKVTRVLTLDGSILSSRMADGSIRVVVRSEPVGFDWTYPEGSGLRSEQKATQANRKLVENSTIENWVPWYVLEDRVAGTTSDGALLGCDQIGHPDEFAGLSMISILTIDLERGLSPKGGIGLLAEGQTVYASPSNLYVATAPWNPFPVPLAEGTDTASEPITTRIHMFDISDSNAARYIASGTVEGTLLSQWSMDEYNGVLRVVTTDASPWGGFGEDAPDTSVTTMRLSGVELVTLGSVGGLGENERVYAVRFIEDKGYVVTFRQVDPLYVVDLGDPANPTVAGELKINGYSAYLHPIGEDLLLGVGQDATAEGRVTGTQVGVFDVSDPGNPRRTARMTFDDSQSQAEWDTHAFLWWAPRGISVLPMQRWSWDEKTGKEDFFSGAIVMSVDANRVEQLGIVQHPGIDDACIDCAVWRAPIMRSIVIGDRLFTVSESGVMATDLDTVEDIGWIPFG